MDARRQQRQQQMLDNRFSWQMPADGSSDASHRLPILLDAQSQTDLNNLTPKQIAAERLRQQEAQRSQQAQHQTRQEQTQQQQQQQRQSQQQEPQYQHYQHTGTSGRQEWTAMPSNVRDTSGQQPVETTAPQRLQPASIPYQQTDGAQNQFSGPTTPLSFGNPTPPISYAVLPQHPTAPLPAQTPPLSVQTSMQQLAQQTPLSPSGTAPMPLSPNATTSPYTPHAEQLGSPNGTAKAVKRFSNTAKTGPYAPDDLVQVHQQAALQHGRANTFADSSPVDVLKHQPGQIAHPNQNLGASGGRAAWQHGLFACAPDADTCCLGMVCPCVVHSRTAYRLGQRSAGRDPTDLLGFSSCNARCGLMAVFACVGCLFPMVLRARVRHAYKLEGGVAGDLLESCCCCCCVVVQNEREVKAREESKRRYAGPGGGEGYVAPTAEMRYRPGG